MTCCFRTTNTNTTTTIAVIPPPPSIHDPNNNNNKQQRRKIVFLHIGKTGGTTLRETILHYGCTIKANRNNRQTCEQNWKIRNQTQSALSKSTTGILHFEKHWGTPLSDATDVLFPIREPVSRFESWYAFQRHSERRGKLYRTKGTFAYQFWNMCFPTMHNLTRALNPRSSFTMMVDDSSASMEKNTTTTKENDDTNMIVVCHSLLKEAFTTVGLNRYGHLSAGYRFYYQLYLNQRTSSSSSNQEGKQQQINRGKNNHHNNNCTVWVVRTEHMTSDLISIDKSIGGSGTSLDDSIIETYKNTHGSEKYKTNADTILPANDNENTVYLCCALLPEIRAYRSIVESARNLNEHQVYETYMATWKRCGVESWTMLENLCAMDFYYDLKRVR